MTFVALLRFVAVHFRPRVIHTSQERPKLLVRVVLLMSNTFFWTGQYPQLCSILKTYGHHQVIDTFDHITERTRVADLHCG